VLVPLLAGEPAHYQVRDWDSDQFGHSLGDWKTVEWSPIVIVEGVGCSRRESIGKLAYTVWIETPEEERLRRGVERDGEGMRDLWEDAIPLENEFFAADETRERADVVVSGTG
jgi:uridine kinase